MSRRKTGQNDGSNMSSMTTAHYISDDVYTLGSVSCAACGHCFPLNCTANRSLGCTLCGTQHAAGLHSDRLLKERMASSPDVRNTSALFAAARLFTSQEIDEAVQHVAKVCGGEGDGAHGTGGDRKKGNQRTLAGTTAVDNRVIEEAFCEQCGVHRPCKSFARQTRSADEGQTIFFQCTVCSAEWQQNS